MASTLRSESTKAAYPVNVFPERVIATDEPSKKCPLVGSRPVQVLVPPTGRGSEKQLAIENDCPPSVDRATQPAASAEQVPPPPPMMPPFGNFASGTARLPISTTF